MFLGGQHEYGDDQCGRDEHLYEHTLGRIYPLLQERAIKARDGQPRSLPNQLKNRT